MKVCPMKKDECIRGKCAGHYEQISHTMTHFDQFCRFMKGDNSFDTRRPDEEERAWLTRKRQKRMRRYEERYHGSTPTARDEE